MCFTNKTKQNFSNEIFVLLPGTAPGVGLGGVQGSKKFKRGHVAYQSDGDDDVDDLRK